MKKREGRGAGPSAGEIRLRGELDSLRRELKRLKKGSDHPEDQLGSGRRMEAQSLPAMDASASDAPADAHELERLRQQVSELARAKQRLSRLYFSQVEDNRRRQRRLAGLASTARTLASGAAAGWLETWASEIRAELGCAVEVWLREPGVPDLRLHAAAGVAPTAGASWLRPAREFQDLFRDEFRVGHSYFVTAAGRSTPSVAGNAIAEPGPGFDWGEGDFLHVPLHDSGGPIACVTLHRPKDGLVPSAEVVELLELHVNLIATALGLVRLRIHETGKGTEPAAIETPGPARLKVRFAATVAQAMRSPLHSLRTRIEGLTPEASAGLEPDVRRLTRLVASLSDLSQPVGTAHEPPEFDIAQEVREVVALLAPVAAGAEVTVKAVVETADTALVANRDPIRHLALCLGGHAVQCAPHGGSVTLRVSGDENEVVLEAMPSGVARIAFDDGIDHCRALVERCGGRMETEGGVLRARLPRRSRHLVRTGPPPLAGHGSSTVLAIGVEMVAEVMDARVVSILGPSRDEDFVLHAAIGLSAEVVRDTRIRSGSGVAGWVAKHRRPVCVSGAEERSEITGSGRGLYRSRTFLSVPVEVDGRCLLVLNVTDPIADTQFGQDDCHLLVQLAACIASACRNAANDAPGAALRSLLRRIEAGRRGGPGRIRLARDIAHVLALDEAGVAALSLAASVPDGAFGAVEDAMPSRVFEAARDIVFARHEWWDGSGYPNGARCDEIPPGARILAVTDAFLEATYGGDDRRPVSQEAALTALGEAAGLRFDPAVVQACVTACARSANTTMAGGEAIATAPSARGGD